MTFEDIVWLKAEKSCVLSRREKESLRAELDQQIKAFLDAGGKITKIEDGQMEGRDVGFDRLFLTEPKK